MTELWGTSIIEGRRKCKNEKLSKKGTPVAVQLVHAGAHAPTSLTGKQPVAPSEIIPPRGNETPRVLTINEITNLVNAFEDAGVDLLDISGGLSGDGQGISGQGYFVYLAQAVKKVVRVPVVGVGNITNPEYADKIIREERVDLVAVGRAMLTNPNWAADAAREFERNLG